jgi:hypothetical protein
MSLELLQSFLSPPDNPVNNDVTGERWSETEVFLGAVLPDDYKEFVSIYGSGAVDDFLWILNPVEENKYLNFREQSKYFSESYLVLKQDFPEYYSQKLFPESGGILTWGFTIDSDALVWVTEGEPNSWKVGVVDKNSTGFRIYDCNMTDFLQSLLDRNISVPLFPDDFPSGEPRYSFS